MSEHQNFQAPGMDRRRNTKLRVLFEKAYVLIEPFFDPEHSWGGRSLVVFAFRVLRENFPDISSEDARAIVAAAHRVYVERNPSRSGHLTDFKLSPDTSS